MKNFFKNIKALTIKDLSIILIFGFAFLGFYHGDFIHTTIMSTYWGDSLYERCGGCNYFPLIYLLFYLWGLFLQFFAEFSFVDPTSYVIGLETSPVFFLYHKLLLTLLFFGSVLFTFKITKILKLGDPKLSARIFALSPFAFFVIFIYSGYDIFSVFFSLVAIYLFIKKRFFWSFLIFSVAVSFKFFAIAIALSMLAILDVKLIKKIGMGMLITCVPAIQVLLFYKEPYFLEGVFYLFSRHTANQNILFNPSFFVGFGFLIWLFALQFNESVKKYFSGQNLIYIPYIAILFLVCYSPIAPPWIIVSLPFIYLVIIKNNLQKPFLALEVIFFAIFIVVITNIWNRNVDLGLANNGIFGFLHNPSFLYKDIYVDFQNQSLLFLIGFGLFYLYFFLPLILNFYNKSFYFVKLNTNQLINLRFFISTTFLLAPFLISPLLTQTDNLAGNLNSSRQFVYSNERNDLYPLHAGQSICEQVIYPYANLEFIAMRLPFNFNKFSQDIRFSYYLSDEEVGIKESYFDNKSIYLRLPKVSEEINQSMRFCIHNDSNQDIDLFVKNKHAHGVKINDQHTFIEKNLPLYLYFKKP
jgi:hypothetical protein